jgi:hypothetical protein
MPLDKQIVGVNFRRGLDTETDKRVTIPGSMVELENCTLSEKGTPVRRNGFGSLVAGTAITSLTTRGDELLALDGTTLKSFSSALASTSSAGTLNNITLAKQQVQRSTGGQDSYDVATGGGITCYVWRAFSAAGTVTGVSVTVRDETTGAVLMPETTMRAAGATTPHTPKAVLVTGAFIIFYGDDAGPPANIYARVIQLSAPGTLGGETTLRSDLSGAAATFDACSSGANAFLYYTTDDATDSTRAIAVTRSGATPSVSAGPVAVTLEAAVPKLDIAGISIAIFDASTVFVAFVTDSSPATPGMWSAVLTSGMTVSFAAARQDATAAVLNVANITSVLSGSTMYVYSDDYGRSGEATATARLVRRTGLNSSNAVTSAAATWTYSMTRPNGTNGPFIASKAFLSGSIVYVPMKVVEEGTGTAQNSWLLLDDSARVVAHALDGTYGPNATTIDTLSASIVPESGIVAIPVGERTLLSLAPNLSGIGPTTINVSATGMARLNVQFGTSSLVDAPLGPVTALGNAVVSSYDGTAATESGFYFFPDVVTAATGGAGNVPNGAHGIVALYEWVDGQGQRHQSAPSVPITLTVAAGPLTCTITVPTLPLTQKSGVTVVAYATKAGGTVYHRVNPVSSPVANSTTAPIVTITYNLTDANLGTGEVLYTDGGALANDPPAPAALVCEHQNRLFGDCGDTPFAVQYSQPWVSGFGAQWSKDLRFRVDSTGGLVKALASIDDKLIIFRPRRIGVLFGNGPTTAGLNNGYQLQDLPTDVGCSEPRSVLVMPEGVIFKSTTKGWYRLGRDLQLTHIGEGVAEWDDQGVTSAVLLDDRHECRFTTNDASGLTLVYNYERRDENGIGQWSTFDNYTGVDAVWWPGGNAYIRATSTAIYKELPPTSDGYAYGDGAVSTTGAIGTSPAPFTGSVIPVTFRTGWLKPGEALQAFQRIWRVLLTGAATGYPAPSTTLAANALAGATSLEVVSTTGFTAGPALILALGAANYADVGAFTVTDGTHLGVGALAANHNAGETVYGTRALGASGTLEVSFYFDGNDASAYQTITVSDVSALVNGNAWDVRLQPNLQKCDSIMMKVVQTPATSDPGASLDFSGMTMEVGVKKGAKKYNAGRTF